MMGKEPFRRRPGWTKVSPIKIVIPHRHEASETEIEDCPGRRGYSWPATLAHRCCCCLDIAIQMAHPATYSIALHSLDLLSIRPLIEQIRKINPHRSEEHTSELQSPCNLVCRLLLEKKK